MRYSIIAPVLLAACTSATSSEDHGTVRDRLLDGPTRITVTPTDLAGNVLARRKTRTEWLERQASVAVEGGALEVSADEVGVLAVEQLALSSAPIDLPEDLFGRPAQLKDVVLSLREPARAVAHWSSDNEAVADVELALDLDWTIVLNGKPSQLGTAHLEPTPVSFFVEGDGGLVRTSLAIHARGTLWSWAEVIEIIGLDLELQAASGER